MNLNVLQVLKHFDLAGIGITTD